MIKCRAQIWAACALHPLSFFLPPFLLSFLPSLFFLSLPAPPLPSPSLRKQGTKPACWECRFPFGWLPLKWVLLAAGRAGWTFDSHSLSDPRNASQALQVFHWSHSTWKQAVSPQCDRSAQLVVVSVITSGFATFTFFREILLFASSSKSAFGMFKTPEGTDNDCWEKSHLWVVTGGATLVKIAFTALQQWRAKVQWRCRGSNPGPHTCKACTLPLSYIPNPKLSVFWNSLLDSNLKLFSS